MTCCRQRVKQRFEQFEYKDVSMFESKKYAASTGNPDSVRFLFWERM